MRTARVQPGPFVVVGVMRHLALRRPVAPRPAFRGTAPHGAPPRRPHSNSRFTPPQVPSSAATGGGVPEFGRPGVGSRPLPNGSTVPP